jgi:hypothetical protein
MITIRIWQEQGKSCESRPAAVLFGSAARGRASRRGVKHNLLRSLSPPEGGPAKRSRSGLSPVSRCRAVLLRPTDHAFGAVPAAEECATRCAGTPPPIKAPDKPRPKTDEVYGCGNYASRPLGSPSITVKSIKNSSGREKNPTYLHEPGDRPVFRRHILFRRHESKRPIQKKSSCLTGP